MDSFQAGDLVYLSMLTDGSQIGDSINLSRFHIGSPMIRILSRRVISEDSPAGKGYLEVDMITKLFCTNQSIVMNCAVSLKIMF
jgi:hypothetical protein